ncbi:MAG TPA: DUF5060 domain-containing protein [Bryobacteraceae bacterium]|nr:DUF5060 domain-containing protein [Bryobacteraceae bacterium]
MLRGALALSILGLPLWAQPSCQSIPAWSPCDFVFDLEGNEQAANAQLRVEFRSPRHKTYLMPAYRDGDRRLIIRFSPTEVGSWDYKLTSNVARLDGKLGQFAATESDAPGFVHTANVHHFQTENSKPHLWMATGIDSFLAMPRAEFDAAVAERAAEKFTHLRVMLEPDADWNEAADRVRAIHNRGMTADIGFARIPEDWKERERYIGEAVARLSAFNVTWAGFPGYERMPKGRELLKDTGALLKKLDPYQHPRTTMAEATSASLLGDGWMNMIGYGTVDANIGGVEHQFYQLPAVATGILGTRDLWNATMNGQYPADGSGRYMTIWREFMAGNRYWELEPYFDLDGGRAVALEGVEYIIYVEKPAGPIEVTLERHGYEVAWINPANGERIKQKDYRGERFTGEPPDASHDWILHISREGEKAGMGRSVKFESRDVPVQEITLAGDKPQFDIAGPEDNEVSMSNPVRVTLKVRRETRATRSLLVEWTAEVAADGHGFRVIGTGRQATLKVPASIVKNMPAVLSLHANILNANGKAYMIDRIFRLVP